MAVSKNRKNHKKRSSERSLQIKRKEEKRQKDFIKFIQNAQEEANKRSQEEAQNELEKNVIETT